VSKAPAFQLYARDWLTDEAVKTMSLAAQGLYVRLLCHQWLEGSIPSTQAVVALATGCNTRTIKANWDMIERFFPLSTDRERRANPRLADQRKSLMDMREQQSKGGKKGAKTRWGTHTPTDKGSQMGNPLSSDGSAVATATALTADHPPTPSTSPGGEQLARQQMADATEAMDKGESEEHIGNVVNNLWREQGLRAPRVYDWNQGAVAVSTLTKDFSEAEILTAIKRIGSNPDLAWAGMFGPVYLTKHTTSGQLVLEAVLNWRDTNANGQEKSIAERAKAIASDPPVKPPWEKDE
jgi:hypothetical protein